MAVENVSVTTPDGECPVVVVTPEGSRPWPAVLLFMDAGGVRQTLVDMAATIAGRGHVVALPELYYRAGAYRPFDVATVFTDPPERARLMEMGRSVRDGQAMRDVDALLRWLAERPDVRGGAVGCTGYCMGGRIALAAAGTFPDRVAAAASFHGGNLAPDEPAGPHTLAPAVRARVYVGVARDDASFPPDQEQRLAAAYADAGVDARIEHYEAAHGFAVPDNPTYDPAAGRRHDEVLRELFAGL
ncbi:MAG TPA: dienelactone hydrolase family protein [Mycobacteriales bacterium]|nr:dienelactone hydrolase family protein [Mycobacteriales bacterium]